MPSIHAFIPPAPTRPSPSSHSNTTSTPREVKTYTRVPERKPVTCTRTPARVSSTLVADYPARKTGRRNSSSIDWPSHPSPPTATNQEGTTNKKGMYRTKQTEGLAEHSSSLPRSEGSSTSGLSSAPLSASPEKRRKATRTIEDDDGDKRDEEDGGEEWEEEDMMIDPVLDDDGDSDYQGHISAKKGITNGTRVLRDRTRNGNGHGEVSEELSGDTSFEAEHQEEEDQGEEDEEDEEEEEEGEEEEEWSEDEDEIQTFLHIEVRLTPLYSPHNPRPQSEWTLQKLIREAIYAQLGQTFAPDTSLDLDKLGNDTLSKNVERVFIAESEPYSAQIDFQSVVMRFHFYRASEIRDLEQLTAVTEDDDEAAAVPAASIRSLPSSALEGIWENLVYDTDLKPRLLRYIDSTMAFSAADIDFNKVSWNRLVLLHGPPGTGKTSLCRALSQKLLIRMGDVYESGKLVEINSHSLFSKWFSESGKLVQKLFSSVGDMMKDPKCLVVVMIDEVESLTAARSAAINGSEPSDALRVVNALLTQLDKLKTQPNVLVMTTSNIPDTIDSAFIDRADEKFFVDYPPPEAVYWILKGCLEELAMRGMMRPVELPKWRMANMVATLRDKDACGPGHAQRGGKGAKRLRGEERREMAGARLCEIAKKCHDANLAGRFLRRLPLLAHSRYLSPTSRTTDDGQPIPRSIEKWLGGFEAAVRDEIGDRERIAMKTVTKLGKGVERDGPSSNGADGQAARENENRAQEG